MLKLRVSVVLFVVTFFIVCVSPSWSQDKKPKPKHAPNALPGVEPEMLTPEYWIALQEDADEVIMTHEEIERFNEKVRNKKVVFRDYYGKPDPLERNFAINHIKGLLMNPLLPLELPDTLLGDSLRIRLNGNIELLFSPPDSYGSREYYDGRNAIYNESMKQEIAEDINVNAIPSIINRRFGIIINHANVRFYPTSVPGYSDTEWEMDMFQATSLCIGNPVAILHESADGDFLYVENPIARGWIAAKDIAIADRKKIRNLTGDKNFLLAAAHKVPVYGNTSHKNFARYLYFSATMPLTRHNSKGYVVKMPYRKSDGSLGVAEGYIKPDADVHIGYLPYTKRNVLIQIFKLLNRPYGFHDQNNKRDCSGTQRVLLRCFGIITGRDCFPLLSSDHMIYINPNLSTEEKMKEVGKIEPVITLAGNSGHIVLYLGRAHNGMLYFMHQGGWGYKDEKGSHLIVNRTSINAVDHHWYNIHQPNVYTTFRF